MYLIGLLAALPLVSGFSDPKHACQSLLKSHSNATFYSLTPEYIEANTDFYTANAHLNPACVFQPTTPEQLAEGIKTLVKDETLFAFRGGGHMPIPGYNNINSTGVLITSAGLNQLEIGPDNATVNVGPGNVWTDVYKYLEPYGKSVVGGRLGVVGVPGYIIGGGVSFFGNEYGWASAMVNSFTAVLADGSIVKATAHNEYSDLFWALRGGGNAFALVTNFEIRTVPSAKVMVGMATFSDEVTSTQFLDGLYEFGINGSNDPKAAAIPLVEYISGADKPTYTSFLFYNGDDEDPAALKGLSSLPTSKNTFQHRSMYQWSTEMDSEVKLAYNLKQRFWVLPTYVNRTAISIIHDTFTEATKNFDPGLGFYILGLAIMPVPKTFFSASQVNGGDPQAIDPNSGPHIWVEESFSYLGSWKDSDVDDFYQKVNANITTQLKEAGIPENEFFYLNDANKLQTDDVWAGYPKESVERLQKIRSKYDPDNVYTELLPGGWKVTDAN
ncbi:hypothetical protein AWENTII_011042 [Aspergillus wentii]